MVDGGLLVAGSWRSAINHRPSPIHQSTSEAGIRRPRQYDSPRIGDDRVYFFFDDFLLPPLDFFAPPLAAFFVAILLTTFHAVRDPHGRASGHNSAGSLRQAC
jgi:hypothetical protein